MTIAFWCVFVAALLPYASFARVRGLDPHAPRRSVATLNDDSARAYAAHLNAFEAFPFFAAMVIIAHILEGPSAIVNGLAIVYIAARIGHLYFYAANQQPPRTACFIVGLLCNLAIFLTPLFH